jgi:hypothetical protein
VVQRRHKDGGGGPWWRLQRSDARSGRPARTRAWESSPSKATSRGADKQTLTLTVTTARKETTYLDDFYSCQKQGIYVQNIDGVLSLVRALAK